MPGDDRVLIIDDDTTTATFLCAAFAEAGLAADSVSDAVTAVEKLRQRSYNAVVLDPMIRHRLNGYAVLNFIEMEQPETLARLFLLTGMSEQTIRRTAPAVLPRLFRKPSAATKAAAAVISACGHSRERKARASILLVEDDPTTADATRRVLNELGYSVELVRDGGAALEVLAERDFDVIMLDLILPRVDGFTLLEHFHDSKPGMLRRVIITTGVPAAYVATLDESTIAGIIQKPLDVGRLAQLLRRCVPGVAIPIEAGGERPEGR